MKYIKYILAGIGLLALTWYISNHWFQLMLIQGQSMEPAYHSWQLVLLEKQPKQLEVGDVIAFRCDGLQAVLVKRIVALPGDRVEIREGNLYVNGARSDVFSEAQKTGAAGEPAYIEYAGIAGEELQLSAQEYFVLGDNLPYSKDSRYHIVGCINKSDIIGKVL